MGSVCRAASALEPWVGSSAAAAFPLAMGYLEGSDLWEPAWSESALAGSTVIPARELAGGDVDLAAGQARLTVHGLYPGMPPSGLFDWMEMSVFFPSADLARPEDRLRYLSWSYDESPVVNLGSANRFDVPVGADGSLALALDTGFLDTGSESPITLSHVADLTVDNDPLRPKLRRGTYLLALVGDPWADGARLPEEEVVPGPELLSVAMTVEEAVVPVLGDDDDDDADGGGDSPPPDDEPPVDTCGGAADRVLAGEDLSSTHEETACESISAYDYRVLETGDVRFDAPSIALGEGFEVRGRFKAGA